MLQSMRGLLSDSDGSSGEAIESSLPISGSTACLLLGKLSLLRQILQVERHEVVQQDIFLFSLEPPRCGPQAVPTKNRAIIVKAVVVLLLFYWHIADLPCCVSFKSTG